MLRARRVLVTVGVAWFLVFASHAGGDQRAHIAELAPRHRLPTVALLVDHAQAGALIAYGPSIPDAFRRAATYVDKILKGGQAWRSTRGAADEVRAHHQSAHGQGSRRRHRTRAPGSSGPGHPVARLLSGRLFAPDRARGRCSARASREAGGSCPWLSRRISRRP